jgi:hypothetical protein
MNDILLIVHRHISKISTNLSVNEFYEKMKCAFRKFGLKKLKMVIKFNKLIHLVHFKNEQHVDSDILYAYIADTMNLHSKESCFRHFKVDYFNSWDSTVKAFVSIFIF